MSIPSLCGPGSAYAIPEDSIATFYAGRFGRFQIVHCSGTKKGTQRRGSTVGHHILVPLGGAFMWHHGSKEPVFANTKSILHVVSNENYHVSHPTGEEMSAVFWPTRDILSQLTHSTVADADPSLESSCTGDIQLSLRELIMKAANSAGELAIEESIVSLMAKIYTQIDCARSVSGKATRAILRAKEYVHAHISNKLSLGEIADAAGVSPVYLTQLFTMTQGTPLYRYHLDLRLDAALNMLPRCDDITGMALDLGFSSHSHFSSEFNRRYGVPPSAHRKTINSLSLSSEPQADSKEAAALDPKFEVVPLCEARGGKRAHSA